MFVAELETGEIAGWIAVFVYRTVEADARAEVSGLVVDERFRSQRVGEHLLARAEEWARESRLPGHRLALERDPRAGARILRAPRLHARRKRRKPSASSCSNSSAIQRLFALFFAHIYRNTI